MRARFSTSPNFVEMQTLVKYRYVAILVFDMGYTCLSGNKDACRRALEEHDGKAKYLPAPGGLLTARREVGAKRPMEMIKI
jgi:hypothetical protein